MQCLNIFQVIPALVRTLVIVTQSYKITFPDFVDIMRTITQIYKFLYPDFVDILLIGELKFITVYFQIS